MKVAFLAPVILLLAACSTIPSSSVPIDLPPLPSRYLTVSCVPTVLPKGALTQAQVEQLWARDRVTLKKCGYSFGGLTAFYLVLQKNLTGAK